MIDHHMPVPWMHLPVSCSAPANENTHVPDVSLVNDVREVLLLAVEGEAGAVHGEGEEEGGPGGRAADSQGGQVGQGLEEVEQLGHSPDSL